MTELLKHSWLISGFLKLRNLVGIFLLAYLEVLEIYKVKKDGFIYPVGIKRELQK